LRESAKVLRLRIWRGIRGANLGKLEKRKHGRTEDIMYEGGAAQQQWPRLSYNEHKTTIEEEPVRTGAAGGSNKKEE